MTNSAPDLQAPVLLLAMPQVLDPFFHHSVVLLLHHTEEGSFGFVVNRPSELRLAEILAAMEISWHGIEDALAFFGGPVQSQMGTVMFSLSVGERFDLDSLEGLTEVGPGILISQQSDDLGRLAAKPPLCMRLFLGYAGWGAGQLVDEIVRNDWLTAPVTNELLFSDHPENVWEEALRSVGVDPSTLPAWTPTAEKEEAN
jgi:putative transcriptional regulator